MQIKQNDAGLFISIAIAPDRSEAGERGADQLAGIARNRQMDGPACAMLHVTRFEAIGLDEHHQIGGRHRSRSELALTQGRK
jgi:hypothetical protein